MTNTFNLSSIIFKKIFCYDKQTVIISPETTPLSQLLSSVFPPNHIGAHAPQKHVNWCLLNTHCWTYTEQWEDNIRNSIVSTAIFYSLPDHATKVPVTVSEQYAHTTHFKTELHLDHKMKEKSFIMFRKLTTVGSLSYEASTIRCLSYGDIQHISAITNH